MLTQAVPLYFKTLLAAGVVIVTSDNALTLAAAILASALAFVKYKFELPSVNESVSVLPLSSATTQAVPLYFKILPFAAPDVLTSDNALTEVAPIRESTLAFVKYKFVLPSDTVSVLAGVLSAANSNLLLLELYFKI